MILLGIYDSPVALGYTKNGETHFEKSHKSV